MNPTELAYRRTAVEGASGFGLLIALYDTLAGDLRRAAGAQRECDIQGRTKEISHALLVIGYLEDWIDREGGGELAQKLISFYSELRSALIEAQARQSAEVFEHNMAVILAIRGTWQELEMRASVALEAPQKARLQDYSGGSILRDEQDISNWSA